MRLVSEPIHSSSPPVIPLAVHLENGLRVYFNEENAQALLTNPPHTTLTAFFGLCPSVPFARTIQYADAPKYFAFNSK